MLKGDEREDRIHAESARNGFGAYTLVTMGFWLYDLNYTDEVSWSLYIMAFGPQLIFLVSMIYYYWKGLDNNLSLSNLRSK